jgi:hypothetical protein
VVHVPLPTLSKKCSQRSVRLDTTGNMFIQIKDPVHLRLLRGTNQFQYLNKKFIFQFIFLLQAIADLSVENAETGEKVKFYFYFLKVLSLIMS